VAIAIISLRCGKNRTERVDVAGNRSFAPSRRIADNRFERSYVMKKFLVAGCLALAIALPRVAVGPTPQHQHDPKAQSADQAKMGQMKMGGMKMDPQMMTQMEAKHKATTERINVLMAQVKSASGDAKTAALADVVAALLDERAQMHEHCAAMMAK
jgi:hypothetical protein